MSNDWRKLSQSRGFFLLENGVMVRFDSGRSQKVIIKDQGEAFLAISIVAGSAVMSRIPDAALRAWIRNRSVPLVGFRLDERGRMIGEAWILKAGLTPDEFQLHIRAIAVECDRFEFQLTGSDEE